MPPVVSLKLSRFMTAYGIFSEVEKLIRHDLPNRYIQGVDNVHVAGALPYFTRINSDPWSKQYPTKEDIIRICAEKALVQVVLA